MEAFKPNFQSFLKKLWSHRTQFIRYFTVGFSAFILDIATLYAFKEYLHLEPVEAVVINQVIVLAYVFWLNRSWSFSAKGGAAKRQLMRFIIMAGANYLISITWIWFFSHFLEIHYLVARIANIILATSWNFVLYKFWVYQTEPIQTQNQVPPRV